MLKKVKLGDVCDLSIGFVGTVTTQYEEGGIPFLRTLNVKPYRIVDNDLKRITTEFHESQKKSQLREGDIAMVHTGVPGMCCVIPKEYDNSNCIDMIVIKPYKDKINSYYLAAYMNRIGYKHIEKQQVGCIQKHFNLKDAFELEIYLPDIQVQNKIGEFVKKLNGKIELNNKINTELESMAKTIYDYWFLQFEFPNEEGKPYKSSGGKMVWNEELKREIPEGWEVTTIGDVTVCHDSKRIPLTGNEREEIKGNIPYYGATGIMGYVNRPIFDGDYVLVAEDGSVKNEKGNPIIQRASGKIWVNNHAHVLEPIKNYSCKLLMMILKDIPVAAIKTGSIQMKINQENLNKVKILDISSKFI